MPGEEWIQEVEAIEEEASDAVPHEFYEPVSPSLVQKQKNRDDYSAPPRPGEGTWIVNEFLNEFLGDEGGRLFTGNAEKSPEFESHRYRKAFRFLPSSNDRW
jgi:hypothetical protein